MVRLAATAGVLSIAVAAAAIANPPPDARAAQLGGALPGGAVISARSVILTPVGGGDSTAVPIGADGSFSATGLTPGRYTARVSSVTVPRQTQGATFGEKVNQGLHAAGGALASGARAATAASPATGADASGAQARGRVALSDTPARLSTNFTIGKQASRTVEVDGDGIAVEVPAGGAIGGITGGAVAGRQ